MGTRWPWVGEQRLELPRLVAEDTVLGVSQVLRTETRAARPPEFTFPNT